MNKKICIIIAINLIVYSSILILFLLLNMGIENYKDIKYKYIRYANYDEGSDICITFYDNDYSVYDCDSEPTGYGFDSEHECKMHYDKKKNLLKFFNCKYSSDGKPRIVYIKKWNFNELVIEYNGKKRYLFNANFYEFMDNKYGEVGMQFNHNKTVSFYLLNPSLEDLETCNYSLNENTKTLFLDCNKIFTKGKIKIIDYGIDYLNATYNNKTIHFKQTR